MLDPVEPRQFHPTFAAGTLFEPTGGAGLG